MSEDHQGRLDRWVHHQWPSIATGAIQKAIRLKKIKLNGQRTEASARVMPGDEVTVWKPWLDLFESSQTHHALSPVWDKRLNDILIYQDTQLLAFNKPAGLACQGGTGQKISFDDLLKAWKPEQTLRLVHRLDRPTTGLFLVAKTLRCAQSLAKEFHDQKIQKTYQALVHGHMKSSGSIDRGLLRDGEKMRTSDSPQALSATTAYRVLHRGLWKGQKVSWLVLFPKSGRTHQLRAHLEFLGHPILGDQLYGSFLACPLTLHCARMMFKDRNQAYDLFACLPPFFHSALEMVRQS